MKIRRLLIFALCSVLSLCSLAQQVTVSGNTVVAGNSRFSGGGGGGGGPLGFAALPTNWVSNLVCTPTVTATLGTTNNIGPNVTGSAVGQPYALSILGLRDAVNNWRDNADNTSQTPHFADVCWLIKVPAGTSLHGSSFDANHALLSLPGKINSSPPTGVVNTSGTAVIWVSGTVFQTGATWVGSILSVNGVNYIIDTVTDTHHLVLARSAGNQSGVTYTFPEPLNYLQIDSTTPLSAGQTVCNHDSPDVSARNPGCANDTPSMWKLQADSVPGGGYFDIYSGADLVTATNWANHIIIADAELTVAPGAIPSQPASSGFEIFHANAPAVGGAMPSPRIASSHLALVRSYIHGWDPGDPGQPLGVGSEDSQNNCTEWDNSGTVNIVNNGATATLTRASGAWFGMTFLSGSTGTNGVYLGGTLNTPFSGTSYTIAPGYDQTYFGSNNTVIAVNTSAGNPVTASGVVFNEVNPPNGVAGNQSNPKYTPGCGDDIQLGVGFNVDYGWVQDNYLEKIHYSGNEGKAFSYGFDNGPIKIVNNHMEGGAETIFSGGSPSDTSGGPGSDTEIRENSFGRDLNWRQLSATASNSPNPPFGCGTSDGTAGDNTCPFNWDIKNSFEMKLGHRQLVDGNFIGESWPDGQSGFCALFNIESGSGGQFVGVYDPFTGLPASFVDNIRFSNNWVRNCAQPIQASGRSNLDGANGGGNSLPATNDDYINNLFTNVVDHNQFGDPGFIWQWASAGGYWPCAMSYTGTGPYTIAANCVLPQNDLTSPAHISNITVDGSHNVTILHDGVRMDPMLSTGAAGTCIATGASWTTCPIVIGSGITGLTAGSYAMTSTGGTGWASDGTGATEVVYNDGVSSVGTLCNSVSTCTSLIGAAILTFASLNSKMTDISPGDDIYTKNKAGDTTCTTNGYAVGAGPVYSQPTIKADSNTVPTGLYVEWQQAAQPSAPSATCNLFNGSGFPKNATLQNNTFLSPSTFAVEVFSQFYSPISNYFHDNVWADNDASTKSDVYSTDSSATGEGTIAFGSWDPPTFEFYHNVMQGRASGNWSVVNCPSGTCTNSFPATVTCSGATADSTCIGYSGFMLGGATYPSGNCAASNNPFNCPLLAAPWASNLTLSMLNYVASSLFQGQGVNLTQLQTAMTQNGYVCPAGANCGSHGPYPDH